MVVAMGVPAAPSLADYTNLRQTVTRRTDAQSSIGCSCAASSTEILDRMFIQGYRADVCVHTNEGVINAHASVLGMASPVMKNMLKLSKKRRGGRMAITIKGVPHDAVHVFLRFIYSPAYHHEKMDEFVMPLLVLSHVFAMPSLKKICMQQLEKRLLTNENVVDIYQLALQCDAPRLCLVCHRMIIKSFKAVSASDGWKAMKQSNPKLEKELLESVVEAETTKEERVRKAEERKIYLQLHEAMEALIHICRDGCRTIGPHDKVLKVDEAPCDFRACKGIESLIRHFAGCKTRVSSGCIHCKRMWQLLELHSRLCGEPEACKVPLCRHFKEKLQQQSKKDEMRWRLLASKVMEVKKFSSRLPRAASVVAMSS